jgi:hypothetical protein
LRIWLWSLKPGHAAGLNIRKKKPFSLTLLDMSSPKKPFPDSHRCSVFAGKSGGNSPPLFPLE